MTVPIRFGIMDPPDAPFPTLRKRWELIEDLGFDQLWVPDHTANFGNTTLPLFDAWTTLAAMAQHTRRIRLGTLVSCAILRHPAILARQAIAVDHLSGGRVELGIGAGITAFDHETVGGENWPASVRFPRFAEYVELAATVLAPHDAPVTYQGRHFSTTTHIMPGSIQRPRIPITVGGQSPTVRRVAAAHADNWNTHGPWDADAETIITATIRQNHELDEVCEQLGRDPKSLRRSLLLGDPLSPWHEPDLLAKTVDALYPAGVTEFVVKWPGDEHRNAVERLALGVMTALKG